MGKKKLSKGYTSKGERRNVDKSICKAMRRDRTYLERENLAWDSWKNGAPTPKTIQRFLGIGPKTLYKQWKSSSYSIKVFNSSVSLSVIISEFILPSGREVTFKFLE